MDVTMDREQVIRLHAEIVRFIQDVPSFRQAIEDRLGKKERARQVFRSICRQEPVFSADVVRELGLRKDTVSRAIKTISNVVKSVSQSFGLPPIEVAAQLTEMRVGVVFYCGTYDVDEAMRLLRRRRTELGADGGKDKRVGEETIIVFDGCTYHRVAQLIREDEESRQERRKYPLFFRNALEDFVFGAMLFDRLGVDKNMWPRGQGGGYTRSVEVLLADLFNVRVQDIAAKVIEVSSPVDLNYLVGSDHRGRIEEDLDKLACLQHHWDYWVAHVERDAMYYMGDNESLSDNSLGPDDYEFAKPYLRYDEDLRNMIPGKLFEACLKRVGNLRPDVAERAREVFVYKVIVAHVAGGLNYVVTSNVIRATNAYRDYLPSEGRSGLISVSWHDSHIGEVTGSLSRVERVLLPYCIERVAHACQDRRSFVDTMLEIADSDSSIVDTRRRLRQLRGELELRNYTAVTQLIEELGEAAARREDSPPVEHYFQSFAGIGRSGRWAQELVAGASSMDNYKKVGSMLAKIFPDTF